MNPATIPPLQTPVPPPHAPESQVLQPVHGGPDGGAPPAARPIAIELEEATWQEFLDRAAHWFGNVRTIQTGYRELAEDTLDRIHESHLRQLLEGVAERARAHEEEVEHLFRIIGREHSGARPFTGAIWTKLRDAAADLLPGVGGGAAGGWRELHQLFISSLNSISAWGAAQELGFALGNREIVEVTFPVINEKFSQHRMLQEVLMETATLSILYRVDV
ncbi:MAG: hypothetical protein ACK47B_15500 [Armatimonadota bacterium]